MVIPYLVFSGKCSEAISFYEKVFNTTAASVFRYSDAPENPEFLIDEKHKNYVMHSEINIMGSTVYLCDSTAEVDTGSSVMMQIVTDTVESAQIIFMLLKDGGIVVEDLSKQFFAEVYGSITDKFGINWGIMCESHT